MKYIRLKERKEKQSYGEWRRRDRERKGGIKKERKSWNGQEEEQYIDTYIKRDTKQQRRQRQAEIQRNGWVEKVEFEQLTVKTPYKSMRASHYSRTIGVFSLWVESCISQPIRGLQETIKAQMSSGVFPVFPPGLVVKHTQVIKFLFWETKHQNLDHIITGKQLLMCARNKCIILNPYSFTCE